MRVCLTHCCRRFYAPHPLKIVEGCLISQHLVLQNRQLNGCCSTVWSESGILIVCFENNKKGRKWLWIIGSFVWILIWKGSYETLCLIWYHLCNWKKVEATMEECYFWWSWWFQPVVILKVTLLHGCFSRFWNCARLQLH